MNRMKIIQKAYATYKAYALQHTDPHEKINRCLTDINRCLTDIFKI